jgi:hypothetical protein
MSAIAATAPQRRTTIVSRGEDFTGEFFLFPDGFDCKFKEIQRGKITKEARPGVPRFGICSMVEPD